jgi:glycerol kinase
MAGLGVGVFGGMADLDDLWRPARVVEPTAGNDRSAARERWAEAISRSAGWIPELSSLDF